MKKLLLLWKPLRHMSSLRDTFRLSLYRMLLLPPSPSRTSSLHHLLTKFLLGYLMTEEAILEIMHEILKYSVVLNSAAQVNPFTAGFLHVCILQIDFMYTHPIVPQTPDNAQMIRGSSSLCNMVWCLNLTHTHHLLYFTHL